MIWQIAVHAASTLRTRKTDACFSNCRQKSIDVTLHSSVPIQCKYYVHTGYASAQWCRLLFHGRSCCCTTEIFCTSCISLVDERWSQSSKTVATSHLPHFRQRILYLSAPHMKQILAKTAAVAVEIERLVTDVRSSFRCHTVIVVLTLCLGLQSINRHHVNVRIWLYVKYIQSHALLSASVHFIFNFNLEFYMTLDTFNWHSVSNHQSRSLRIMLIKQP